jgi:hypothetical protein
MGEWMYRTKYSWPRHWLEVSGKLHVPAALPPEKDPRYPLYRRLGEAQGRSGRGGEEKILTLPGLELRPLVAQFVASRCTDYAILVLLDIII